jgi:hypothetical protein
MGISVHAVVVLVSMQLMQTLSIYSHSEVSFDGLRVGVCLSVCPPELLLTEKLKILTTQLLFGALLCV